MDPDEKKQELIILSAQITSGLFTSKSLRQSLTIPFLSSLILFASHGTEIRIMVADLFAQIAALPQGAQLLLDHRALSTLLDIVKEPAAPADLRNASLLAMKVMRNHFPAAVETRAPLHLRLKRALRPLSQIVKRKIGEDKREPGS